MNKVYNSIRDANLFCFYCGRYFKADMNGASVGCECSICYHLRLTIPYGVSIS